MEYAFNAKYDLYVINIFVLYIHKYVDRLQYSSLIYLDVNVSSWDQTGALINGIGVKICILFT